MATDQPTTKDGNIILRSVDVPNQVDPGEPFDVDVEVSNGAAYINPWDPDKCGLAPPGYKLRVVLDGPSGEELTKTACHTTTEAHTRDETYRFTVSAPDAGRAEVEAHVEMRGSRKRTDTLEASTLVSDERAAQPDPGPNDDSSDSRWNLPGNDDESNDDNSNPFAPDVDLDLGQQATLALGVVALLAVAWTVDSGADLLGG